MNSALQENSFSRSQLNVHEKEKSESLYDFAMSTSRSISAPLPSAIGLDVSFKVVLD
jgi:hypothetical protein